MTPFARFRRSTAGRAREHRRQQEDHREREPRDAAHRPRAEDRHAGEQQPVRPAHERPAAGHEGDGDHDRRVEQDPGHRQRRRALPLGDLAGDRRVDADVRGVRPGADAERVDERRERPGDQHDERGARRPARGDVGQPGVAEDRPARARSCRGGWPTARSGPGRRDTPGAAARGRRRARRAGRTARSRTAAAGAPWRGRRSRTRRGRGSRRSAAGRRARAPWRP